MVARAVMRAWQISRQQPDSMQPQRPSGPGPRSTDRSASGTSGRVSDDDPSIRVDKREDIVPRRPVVAVAVDPGESVWNSHLFWKGILVGALIVLLVKTAIAIQAPFGVDWYGEGMPR